MSLTSGFFDAMEQGEGNYDRVYTAAEFAHYFSLLVGNGVFPSPDTGLNVLASEPASMTVKIGDGSGWINGYFVTVAGGHSVTLEAASGAGTRIDSIIMQWNSNDRKINIIAKSGTASGNPQPVTLQRDAELWELELAQITVGAGVSSVDQTKIKDMRSNETRCGLVTALLKGIDPSTFLKQSEAEFNQWFLTIMNKISSEDVAGSLLKMITEVDNRSKETESLVKNISVVDISKVGDMFLSGRSLTDSRVLLCDGSVISKKEYPELFNAIGYLFGGGYKQEELKYSQSGNYLSTDSITYYSIKIAEEKYLIWGSYNADTIYSCVFDVKNKTMTGDQSLSNAFTLSVYKGMYRTIGYYSHRGSYSYVRMGSVNENGLIAVSPVSSTGTRFDETSTPYGILSIEYSDNTGMVTSIKLYRSSSDTTVYAVTGDIKHTISIYLHYAMCIYKGVQYILAGGVLCKAENSLVSAIVLPSIGNVTSAYVTDVLTLGNRLILSMSVTDSSNVSYKGIYTYEPEDNRLTEVYRIPDTGAAVFVYDEHTIGFTYATIDSYSNSVSVSSVLIFGDTVVSNVQLDNPIIPTDSYRNRLNPIFDDSGNFIAEYGIISYYYSNSGTGELQLNRYTANKEIFAIPKTPIRTKTVRDTGTFEFIQPMTYIKAKEK